MTPSEIGVCRAFPWASSPVGATSGPITASTSSSRETPSTRARGRAALRLGRKQLAKVTALDLQCLYADLLISGLSARSIGHTHRCLHRAFEQAVLWGMIARNPCDGATPPRAEAAEMKVLTPDQSNRLLAATAEHLVGALYVLAVTTGMRTGELLGLKWDDIDLDAGRLTVRRALQQQNEAGLIFVTPKSARSRRTILLSQRAVAALRSHRERQTVQRRQLGDEWKDQGLVIAGAAGGLIDPSWSRQTFYAALEAAGLPHIRFHDLRHTAATLLLLRGVNVKLVSEMRGAREYLADPADL